MNRIIIAVVVVIVAVAAVFLMFSVKEDTVKIGAILSLSGPASYVGREVRDGMLLAIKEINTWGGVNGRKIELVIEDSQTDPQKGKQAFKKIEANDHPFLYVSTLSSVSLSLTSLAEENRVVLVGLVVSTPEFLKGREWVFRYYPSAKDEILSILRILDELSVKNLGILYLNDAYGKSVFELLKDEFIKRGGLVKGEAFELSGSDFKDQIKNLKDMQAIYVVGLDSHLKDIFRQLREDDFSEFILGPTAATLPYIISMSEASGVYAAAPIIYDPNYVFAQEIEEKYKSRYNKPFNHYAANGYDFVKILVGLLEDKQISRKNIKSLLEEGFAYFGVLGGINAKPGEHDIGFPLYPAQIANGRIEYRR